MTQSKFNEITYTWLSILKLSKIPKNGVITEVAPGYEPKIAQALSLYGFRGTLYIIEPDDKACASIVSSYKHILPTSKIYVISKTLQEIQVGKDLPPDCDAILASHPFDDMVIEQMIKDEGFFTQEAASTEIADKDIQSRYNKLNDSDYIKSIRTIVRDWRTAIKKIRPSIFIASQYPSLTLARKGLMQRQMSGFIVLDRLKKYYQKNLIHIPQEKRLKDSAVWWIVARLKTSCKISIGS